MLRGWRFSPVSRYWSQEKQLNSQCKYHILPNIDDYVAYCMLEVSFAELGKNLLRLLNLEAMGEESRFS